MSEMRGQNSLHLTALLFVALAVPAFAFEKIALIDSYDFGHCNDIETNQGVDEIIDFALKTGCETMLWRNQGGGDVRYPSAECPMLEASLERWRTSGSTIWAWTRLAQCETNHLAYALASLSRRGIGYGIHHTFEECHWMLFSSLSRWNFDHPQYWCQRKDGQPWPGKCALSNPAVLEHRLKMIDEMLAMGGGDVFYLDSYRDGGWDAGFECTPEMRKKWKAQYGCEPPDDPSDERWLKFVSPYYHAFLRGIRQRLDATGRKIRFLVSISRFHGPGQDGEWTRHAFDWKEFVKEGVIDGIVADGIRPDPKDPWGSTERAYRWVMAHRGKAQVYFHCSEYEEQYGVGKYMKLTGLSKAETARKLLQIARDVGGAGVVLECVDPHLYGPEINAVLREFGDGANTRKPQPAKGTAVVPAIRSQPGVVCRECPVYSPDGTRLAFQEVSNGVSRIGIRDLRNGSEIWLDTGAGQAVQPCWTPDGGLVYVHGNYTNTAFRSRKDGWRDARYNLHLWKNGKITRLTDGHWRDYSPSVGADGKVTFVRNEGVLFSDHHWMWSMSLLNPSAAKRIRCTSLGSSSSIFQPSVSPDGKLLAWAECYGSVREAWNIRIASASEPMKDRILTPVREVGIYPRWSPDSKFLVYSGYRSGDAGWGVWLMDVRNGLHRRVCYGMDASFSPDGKSIAYIDPDGKLMTRALVRGDWPIATNALASDEADPSLAAPHVLCTTGFATNRTEVPFVGHSFGKDGRTVYFSARIRFNGNGAQQDFLNVSFHGWGNLAIRLVTLGGEPYFATMLMKGEWLPIRGLGKLAAGEHVITGIRGANRRLYLSVDGGYPIKAAIAQDCAALDGSEFLLLARNLGVGSAVLSAEVGTGWPAHVPRLFDSKASPDFVRLSCRAEKGETRDLKVGLWAWPAALDWDGDGDLDLVVSCPCTPYDGTYLFRNPGGGAMPVFSKGERIGKGWWSFVRGNSDRNGPNEVFLPGSRYANLPKCGFGGGIRFGNLPDNVHSNTLQANVWREVDFDGDGRKDLLVGTDDWTFMCKALWGSGANRGLTENYAPDGRWIGPSAYGNIYFIRNVGTSNKPEYARPKLLRLKCGRPLTMEGSPAPMCEDWDGDGDLDIICGNYVNEFTYFENVGTRTSPVYESGRRIRATDGRELLMDLAMITPSAIDWDGDGRLDIICGDEDGRVVFIRNVGSSIGRDPVFEQPRYFRQEADDVCFGALSTPCGVDWDGDGDWDIVTGDSAGHIAFIENLSGQGVSQPHWAEPVKLKAGGSEIRILAGKNGSIQGPIERNWGYTCLTAADWDGDGLPDLMVNSIWGDVVWYRNIGTRRHPNLAPAQDVIVEWEGEQPPLGYGWYMPRHKKNPKGLLTQWRTTPVMFDWNGDGLMDLIMLDREGYLAFFERAKRNGRLVLLPPKRIFADVEGVPLCLNPLKRGHSGRRKIAIADVNGDGRPDLLANSYNVSVYLNMGETNGVTRFADPIEAGRRKLSHHTTAPTTVDFDNDGHPELLAGAEDGYFYFLLNPRLEMRN